MSAGRTKQLVYWPRHYQSLSRILLTVPPLDAVSRLEIQWGLPERVQTLLTFVLDSTLFAPLIINIANSMTADQ